ncbi:MAG: NAD-dependent epimerase/dehydratase family protein [Gammaproteobacteria bacterium]|nr:NAD-dependent epimerase/dehydratase family protein [Gammaproteobacteria bacterium]
MHVLVTGGAGFIGSHIVEYHLNRGDSVLAVDDLSTGSIENVRPFLKDSNFRFEEADILTWQEIEKAVCWSDRIYHMAAVVGMFKVLKEPISVLAVNIAGTERILRAAKACAWNPDILIASTSEVYGNRDAPGIDLSEEMEPVVSGHMTPRSNYAVSKMADELFGLSYARQHNMNVRIVRFFNVIGPRQTGIYGMVAPRFVKQAVSGKPISVYGDGTQTRCFLDVRDAVVALDLLIDNPNSVAEIVNVGRQHEVSINELAQLVKEKSPTMTTITHTPYEEAYGKEFDEIFHRRPSVKKLQALTSFTPKWTLEKTILDLIDRECREEYEKIEAKGEENGYNTLFYSESQYAVKPDRFIARTGQNSAHA